MKKRGTNTMGMSIVNTINHSTAPPARIRHKKIPKYTFTMINGYKILLRKVTFLSESIIYIKYSNITGILNRPYANFSLSSEIRFSCRKPCASA
jgi:hypothetical protein